MESEIKEKGHWFNVIIFGLLFRACVGIYVFTKYPFSPIMLIFIWLYIINPLVLAYLIHQRSSYKLCFLLSFLVCIDIPWGTAIGIFNIVLLRRESIRAEFGILKPANE